MNSCATFTILFRPVQSRVNVLLCRSSGYYMIDLHSFRFRARYHLVMVLPDKHVVVPKRDANKTSSEYHVNLQMIARNIDTCIIIFFCSPIDVLYRRSSPYWQILRSVKKKKT
ncbi:uncharacterized protein EURHEDRAFT_44385 [Aspergillus ruber CBS 135680]|uniref:Uncharacterized protein n=1 Tax=Aspergillus ruber (strain CBS 135680) TaxID=1388766 RepID=A0A017SGE3_ASPRC|nr:uncharacterized protein EURHEDRAFT_44385 [Aspergillus ruber CBS 135680]EYE96017.1 hypothetical protein EURHEDRAFT_44385 [Aspergillus ruber CBS 135680]